MHTLTVVAITIVSVDAEVAARRTPASDEFAIRQQSDEIGPVVELAEEASGYPDGANARLAASRLLDDDVALHAFSGMTHDRAG